MDGMEVHELEAVELVREYESHRISPVETMESLLRRIRSLNEEVNAYCLVDEELALRQARESERRLMNGTPRGVVEGIPVSIKDVLETKGWPTLRGSRAVNPDGPWDVDAPAVARLREQGAILIGKTTTAEFGWKAVTDSPLTGVTRNPWDTTRTAGGSSGGSAAAVALGMGPLSVGTDGGGSIRIPAAFCGVVGLKPTFGTVPAWPASPFGTLSNVGPIARSVADVALLLDVISGPDMRDWGLNSGQPSFSEELRTPLRDLRIAWLMFPYVRMDPDIQPVMRRAVETLGQLGASVEEVPIRFVRNPISIFGILWYSGAAAIHGEFGEEARRLMDPGFVDIANVGIRLSALDHVRASQNRARVSTQLSSLFADYDLLLTPTLPIAPFEVGREVPEGEDGAGRWPGKRWMTWTPFTYPFNLSEQPAITVPSGFTQANLPIGLQIVGKKYDDRLVLRTANAYEHATRRERRLPDIGRAN